MAKKESHRVNGRHGEVITLEGDELSFKTGGKSELMAKEVVSYINVVNTEEAREIATTSDMVLHGAWTQEMPATGGNYMFLVAKGRAHCWIMEITKAQVPNAAAFCETVMPREKGENDLSIPNRVINTPLGGLFTIGSIACTVLAIFCVYSFNQPILALVLAIASIVMFINVK